MADSNCFPEEKGAIVGEQLEQANLKLYMLCGTDLGCYVAEVA